MRTPAEREQRAKDHDAISINLQDQINQIKQDAKAHGLLLADKLSLLSKAKALETQLHDHRLNYFEFVDGAETLTHIID